MAFALRVGTPGREGRKRRNPCGLYVCEGTCAVAWMRKGVTKRVMKNTVPLIVAVVLGLIAVFAVSRMIRPKDTDLERQYAWVVSAAKEITPSDGEIKESWVVKRRVDVASLPAKAIPWREVNRVIGQRTIRMIARNDYILASDVSGSDIRLSQSVGEGEWAVPVTFSDPALIPFLQPGDEISILGTFMMRDVVKKTDQSEKPEVIERRATSVIFPCVRILDIGKGDAIRREEGAGGNGTIIVSLTPQQAATLVAAQRTMELYPALRRSDDTNALKRRDVGVVSDVTFQSMKTGLEPITLPDTPRTTK